jgi:hypothetical protein
MSVMYLFVLLGREKLQAKKFGAHARSVSQSKLFRETAIEMNSVKSDNISSKLGSLPAIAHSSFSEDFEGNLPVKLETQMIEMNSVKSDNISSKLGSLPAIAHSSLSEDFEGNLPVKLETQMTEETNETTQVAAEI